MKESQPEHPSTYFIEDRSNREEIERLVSQDRMMTDAMGGVLSEQPDPARFHRVLDVGCGTSGWLLQLAHMSPQIQGEGTDISKVMLDYAREQAVHHHVEDRVTFHQMDALRMLEFPDGYFDLVNLRFGASFLRTWDWPKLLQEMHRVCGAGGVVRISDTISVTSTSLTFTTFINEMVIPVFIQAGYFFRDGPKATADHLKTMLSGLGFQDVHLKTYPVEYRAGTPQHRLFVKDMHHLFHLLPVFWRKWSQMPENFERLSQQVLSEMEHPDFVAFWPLFTIWGTV